MGGAVSVKRLRRLRIAAELTYSREEPFKYTDLMPGGSTREFTFYMEAKSIITRPSNARPVAAQTAKGELGDKLVGGGGHAGDTKVGQDVYAVSAYILKI